MTTSDTLDPSQLEGGCYYWVRFGSSSELTAGFYTPLNNDGTPNAYPWELIGSDEIFTAKEVVAQRKCV